MTSAQFNDFYTAVHGREPFPWQRNLAAYVLERGTWPKHISVPTACGKTSVLDVAIFALAAQADSGSARTAPMRVFFVVDRRLVVDDVTKHAQGIRDAIDNSTDGITLWVRDQLKKYGSREPLAVATLRGGMYRGNTWADEPNQPLICASTVDQTGSRLLFRGYGVSDSRRPVDAGLTGNDSLIILDEAHLSNPFLTTLRAVRKYQVQHGGTRTGRPVQMVEMSATPRGESNAEPAITLSPDDWKSPLGDRLTREKRVLLKEAASLESAAVEEARRLQAAGSAVVAIVMNTVASARAAFHQLPGACEKILLTGRIRPYDRDELLSAYLNRMKAGRNTTASDPLFVVATQTIEAGADLDFDALVTELAPLDCLIQRFGRLNRIGRRDRAEGAILRPKRVKERTSIYGDRPENTWNWLSKYAVNGGLDFCASALEGLLETKDTAGCMSQTEDAPLLLPAHLDAWVQTNPAPAEDPDVAPFLHGSSTSADVQIVWRADLPEKVEEWTSMIAAVPPLSTEALPLPIGAARRWLRNQDAVPVTDTEANSIPEADEKSSSTRSFLIWRGPENSIASGPKDVLNRLRAGDTIVVHSSEGGCDRFGWNPNSSAPVTDIGDQCNNRRAGAGRGRYRLRLHPEVFYGPEQQERREHLRQLLEQYQLEQYQDGDAAKEQLLKLVEERLLSELHRIGNALAEEQLRKLIEERIPERKGKGSLRPYFEKSLLWTLNGFRKSSATEVPPDESDEDDGSSFTVEISLERHTTAVVARAAKYAGICAGARESAAIAHAARLHDLGKLDDRFQMALGAGTEPLAKSGSDPSEYGRALRRAGYPKGARHEFASVLIAEQAPSPPDCDRQLALHLIGTHHGQGRPIAPFWRDAEDPEIRASVGCEVIAVRSAHRLARLDSGWIDRFWNLNRAYGWWGLAFLEAILRRADCIVSREEQERRS